MEHERKRVGRGKKLTEGEMGGDAVMGFSVGMWIVMNSDKLG